MCKICLVKTASRTEWIPPTSIPVLDSRELRLSLIVMFSKKTKGQAMDNVECLLSASCTRSACLREKNFGRKRANVCTQPLLYSPSSGWDDCKGHADELLSPCVQRDGVEDRGVTKPIRVCIGSFRLEPRASVLLQSRAKVGVLARAGL